MNGFGRGEKKSEREKSSILTKETVGMTMLLFSVLALVIAITGPLAFGDVGLAIAAFFIGLCGYFVYPLLVLTAIVSLMMITGKKFIPARWIVRSLFLLVCVFLIVHTATAERLFVDPAASAPVGYGAYLAGCWSAAAYGMSQGTGGGVLFGLLVYPLRLALSAVGCYVLFSMLAGLALFLILMLTPFAKLIKRNRSPRPKKAQPKPASGPVSFDDLPDSRPAAPQPSPQSFWGPQSYPETPAPYGAAPYEPVSQSRGDTYYPNPFRPQAEPRPAAPAPQPRGDAYPSPYRSQAERPVETDPKKRSREILFGTCPADSYKNNLIFDSKSAFNNRSRPDPAPASPPQSPAQSSMQSPAQSSSRSANPYKGYAGNYSADAERERPPMPRRIRPLEREYPSRDESFDYPAPTFRAPASPADTHDLYTKDVPPMSEEPPVLPEEPRINDPAPRFETQRYDPPAASRLNDPAPSAPQGFGAREEEPARDDRDLFGRDARGFGAREEEPARDDRDLFGRETRGFGESAREEEPARDDRDLFGRETRGFGAREEEPARDDRDLFGRDTRGFGESDREPSDEMPETPRFEETDRREERDFGSPNANLFDDDSDVADYRVGGEFLPESESRGERGLRDLGVSGRNGAPMSEDIPAKPSPAPAPAPAPAPEPAPKKRHVYKKYRRPNLNLFEQYDDKSEVSQEEIGRNSGVILDTLHSFKIEAEIAKVTCGSTVTRYDIEIPKNVPIGMVIKRDMEIGMRLMVRDGVNMYVNNETGSVSIEVPNRKRATVGIRSILSAPEYVNAKPGSLVFAMGKDIEGRNVLGDIVKMKHLLVAGSTGSGKSVCLNAMLISLICRYSPEDLRLILIDPKRVEFAAYDGIPHLMINEIITEAQKAVSALNWALKEMERRYGLFEQKTRSGGVTIQNIDQYNENLSEDEEKLCKIVIVFDELADFMMVAKKEIEERVSRITAKARAAGIHAVIATQRPSVDVITGVIKGNLPTRIAFRTIQANDSRIILDEQGAEKLLGMGDMLYRTEGMFNCLRVQGAYLSNQEIHDIIADIKEHNESYFDEEVSDYINSKSGGGTSGGGGFDGGDDNLGQEYIEALGVVVKRGQASISLIQRSCGVGYNHAGKIVEWMESMGYISPFDGKAKARTVLLTKEEFEAKYGPLD